MSVYLGSNKVNVTVTKNQDKVVTPSASQQTITYDAGYTGLGTVTVYGVQTVYTSSSAPSSSIGVDGDIYIQS